MRLWDEVRVHTGGEKLRMDEICFRGKWGTRKFNEGKKREETGGFEVGRMGTE